MPAKNTEFRDRRKNERLNCRVPVLCKKGTMFDNSQTVNISESGMGLISQRFIPVNTSMIMQIALSPKSSPLLAVGRVRWVEKMGYMDRYRLGMEFTDISRVAQERLSQHLDDAFFRRAQRGF
jgi:c-di-GMP-binding flagellar brake protein YcgR